jgi:hypothetical protein
MLPPFDYFEHRSAWYVPFFQHPKQILETAARVYLNPELLGESMSSSTICDFLLTVIANASNPNVQPDS